MLRLLAIVTLLAASVGMRAQGKTGIPITAPPGVTALPVEQAGGPFLKSFNSGSAALIPYSVILTNHTNQPIIVVVTDWKYLDAHGFVRHFWLRADSTMAFSIPPLAGPHQSVLLRPDGSVSESELTRENSGHLAGTVLTPKSVARFASAKDVGLTIDCVIFANGEYIGPNNEHYPEEIKARNEAARELLNRLQQAKRNGKSLTATLLNVATHASARTDTKSGWMRIYADQAKHLSDPIQFLSSFCQNQKLLPALYKGN